MVVARQVEGITSGVANCMVYHMAVKQLLLQKSAGLVTVVPTSVVVG